MPIKFSILFAGSISKATLNVLFEPKNTHSVIRKDLAEKLGLITTFRRHHQTINIIPYNIAASSGSSIGLGFTINNLRLRDSFTVVPDMPEDVIFGDPTIRMWGMKLDYDNNTVIIDPRVTDFMLKGCIIPVSP